MFDLFSCKLDFPDPAENWFATRIFTYESAVIDQNINQVYLVDGKTGFLFGTDYDRVIDRGGSPEEQSAFFFRSVDGGRFVERQNLGNGKLEYISRSADEKAFYIICARFGEYDTIKPAIFKY